MAMVVISLKSLALLIAGVRLNPSRDRV
jgi:hypothetical protein